MSNLSAFNYIGERSEGTPGLWNSPLSILSANIQALNSDLTINFPSGNTLSIFTGVEVSGGIHAQYVSVGSTPASEVTTAAVVIGVNSAFSDYLHLTDSSGARSSYVIGSRAGGTADGLNIWDASGDTMLVTFSKQSIRFWQNVVGPVFDVGGALADTLNAATFGTGADSLESRIQAAISAATAAGISRVYLPANMYPYSAASISFDTRVQMVREGGDWTVFDIVAYGANGNGSVASADANHAAIQSAISGANADPLGSGLAGGIVSIPAGQYIFSKTILVPPAQNQGQVIIRGSGMRISNLYPQTSAKTAILFGSATPDISGVETFRTQYCGLEDVHILGSLLTDTGCAVQFTEMQKGWMQNVLIESFQSPGAIGVYLRGSTGASGLHAWRNGLINVVVATTYRPLVLENADENDFFNCNWALVTGQTSAMSAVQVLQGRNNRWFGGLLSGEASSITTGRPTYSGFVCTTPSVGDNANNQAYGLVAEGFDSGVSIATGVNNTVILYYNASVCSKNITDAGSNTLFYETANLGVPLYQHPSGTAAGPAFAFRSEGSLGFFRSTSSRIGIANGVLESPINGSSTTPVWTWASSRSNGFLLNGGPGVDIIAAGTVAFRTLANSALVVSGSATGPGLGFTSEASLGFFRSGASAIRMSYGQLSINSGSATTPGLGFSDLSLGFYKSAKSTIQQSYGTFVTSELWATSGLSVGGGTLIPQISSMSSLVGAFVVQGSSSSFTGIAWSAAGIGDIILVGVVKSTAASSISSGLVAHSHVTVAGQIEFRLSNVSTLVQNQSAQTWVFTRIRPF